MEIGEYMKKLILFLVLLAPLSSFGRSANVTPVGGFIVGKLKYLPQLKTGGCASNCDPVTNTKLCDPAGQVPSDCCSCDVKSQ